MNTDTMTKSATLEDLIERGRMSIARKQEARERVELERTQAHQKAEEAQLELIMEQLPEGVHPFVELGGPVANGYGTVYLRIKIPDCDQISSRWKFNNGAGGAERMGEFKVFAYRPDYGDGFPRADQEHLFEDLFEAIAFAVDQGPTYEMAEHLLAERAKRDQAKAVEPTLRDQLLIALEKGDERGRGLEPEWRMTTVLAEALVSIAGSLQEIARSRTEY